MTWRMKSVLDEPDPVELLRQQFRLDQPECALCGLQSSDIHEIACGPHRKSARGVRAALLSLCRGCHNIVQGWPVARQLGLKILSDPEYYDRVEVNRLRGRPDDAVNEREVACQVLKVLQYKEWLG